jgi:hypothetical protein
LAEQMGALGLKLLLSCLQRANPIRERLNRGADLSPGQEELLLALFSGLTRRLGIGQGAFDGLLALLRLTRSALGMCQGRAQLVPVGSQFLHLEVNRTLLFAHALGFASQLLRVGLDFLYAGRDVGKFPFRGLELTEPRLPLVVGALRVLLQRLHLLPQRLQARCRLLPTLLASDSPARCAVAACACAIHD